MWTPEDPDDFSTFIPSDFPAFLEWWQREQTDAIALQVASGFVEGVTQPWLELLATDSDRLPEWIKTVLRWRLAAQWAYQQGVPLMSRLERGLPGLLGVDYPEQFRITPAQLAEIPPQIRQGFLEGNKFSLSWVKRLSSDAKELMGDLMAANQLRNQNPRDVVPILERVLRRDLIARARGVAPGEVTPEQMNEWLQQAEFSVLEGIARRAELIAVTEGMRMQNLGILTSMEAQGETLCYVMPHRGTCELCQELIDGRVFLIKILKQNAFANIGVKKDRIVPAIPQHPRCLHSIMEVPWRFRKVLRALRGDISEKGILLEWYGLPGGEQAFEELGLPRKPWLTLGGAIA